MWHLASFDAPTVAVVWAFTIARVAHIHLAFWVALLLAAGTWTVYVLDRILDARSATGSLAHAPLRERHHFHWRHRRIFIPFAVCSALAALAMIVKLMPPAAREHNSIIAAAALAYFSGVHGKARFPHWLRHLGSKELLVGILFASGCVAPTLARLHSSSVLPVILALGVLAALAWLNCAAISSWESDLSSDCIPAAAFTLAITGLLLSLLLGPALAQTSALLACAAISALLIAGLHYLGSHIHPVTLRALADLVLLVPGILLIPGVLPA